MAPVYHRYEPDEEMVALVKSALINNKLNAHDQMPSIEGPAVFVISIYCNKNSRALFLYLGQLYNVQHKSQISFTCLLVHLCTCCR